MIPIVAGFASYYPSASVPRAGTTTRTDGTDGVAAEAVGSGISALSAVGGGIGKVESFASEEPLAAPL
jgi:hypothetical protein